MKKRGVTLIEIIVVIAILSLLVSISFKSSTIKNVINTITTQSVKSDISNLISFAKSYCYSTGNPGKLEVNQKRGTISFIDTRNLLNRNVIAEMTLPNGYKFLESFNISVSTNGVVSSDSIILRDLNGEYHKVTILVGVDLVNVY